MLGIVHIVTAWKNGGEGSSLRPLKAALGLWLVMGACGVQWAAAANSGYIDSMSPSWFYGCPETVTVRVKNTGDSGNLTVLCQSLPSGWSVGPSERTRYVSSGRYSSFAFTVTPPTAGGEGVISWWLLDSSRMILDFDYQSVTSLALETISKPSTPAGPSTGERGQSLSFSTSASSSAGHSLEYCFNWGDGTTSAWGASTQSHTYSRSGTNSITVQARCATHTCAVSSLSDAHSVSITAGPPVISVTPASLDFGAVEVNATADLSFTVSNSGGGTLTGSVTVLPPFSIASGASYALDEGQSQGVVVRYSPTSGGTHDQFVTFTGEVGASRPVSGTARHPAFCIADVATQPGSKAVLKWSGVDGFQYGISRSTNLLTGFVPIHTSISATPPINVYTVDCASANCSFYRIDVE